MSLLDKLRPLQVTVLEMEDAQVQLSHDENHYQRGTVGGTLRGGAAMSRLDIIMDWETRAETVRFRVSELALGCGVTDRHLRRFFLTRFGVSPHKWLTLRRLKKAMPMLSKGTLVKEVAAEAGFSRPENFSRRFKRFYNANPSLSRGFGPP